MKLLTLLAWRNIFRQQRRTMLTVGAMALGVAFCMVTIALMDGIFEQGLDILVRQNLGHVQVHALNYPKQRAMHDTIQHADDVVERLDKLPGTSGVTSRVFGYALLAARDKSAGAQLTGVVPTRENRVTVVHERMQRGRYLSPTAGSEMVLGSGLAESLGATLGDEVVAVTQAADGSMGNVLFRVVGIFKTGSVVLDRSGAFVHQQDLQALLALPGQVHEIALLAQTHDLANALSHQVQAVLKPDNLLVRTWSQVNPAAAQMVEMQDVSMWIVLLMVFSVAALGVLNTMLMSVFERTRELGMLVAVGMKPRQVVLLILLESLALAMLSILLGGLLGLALDTYLVTVGWDLSSFMGDFSFSELAFSSVLKGVIRPGGIAATFAGLLVITLLASLWPAVRAARLQPIEAMRQE